jgi:hypothetical protein
MGVTMASRKLLRLISVLPVALATLLLAAPPASADSSHARIIRLSLVSGDVRFAAQTHGDPLSDPKAVWDSAQLNLPIRQGYVVATDNGRAEVEFENGTVAFLKENTVLQFYDLSLKDGALMTRLVLRQGSASFHVNPVGDDYFSVTGGDFTAETAGHATFRVDNFDDGSTVEDLSGSLSVLHQDQATRLYKGQSLSMKAGDQSSVSIGSVPEQDEFDRWVSGQVDNVSKATSAVQQYTSSPYYAAGFGSLYSYGSFFNCGGYGYGWRPFGAGYGWSPFTDGQWIMDPAFGWTWMSYQPWGWAPYHYGGWLFDSGCGGWFYSPPLLYGYYPGTPRRRFPPVVHPPRPIFHPVTGAFVRNKGVIGIVPLHPLDAKGKTPMNLEHGVFGPESGRLVNGQAVAAGPAQKWETLKSAPKDAFSNGLSSSAPPVRVSRIGLQGPSSARIVSVNKDSSIAYDPKEHRFVNANGAASSTAASSASLNEKENHAQRDRAPAAANQSASASEATARNSVPVARNTPPRVTVPPPAPRYSGGGERTSSGGSGRSWWGGSSRSSGASGASSGHSAPAPHASSGGGHPH